MSYGSHRADDQAQRVLDREQDQEFRDERRADYKVLSSQLREAIESIRNLEKRFSETEEMWENIRSLSRTFGMIEKTSVWLVKVGALIAGGYATYKFIIADLIRQIGGKGT